MSKGDNSPGIFSQLELSVEMEVYGSSVLLEQTGVKPKVDFPLTKQPRGKLSSRAKQAAIYPRMS